MKTLFLTLAFSVAAFATNPVINGQTIFSDSAPTLTECGTSPIVATGGTSNGATITIGTDSTRPGAPTEGIRSCTLTFATAFTNPPVVGLSVLFLRGTTCTIGLLSTTVMRVNCDANMSGQKFSFVAF